MCKGANVSTLIDLGLTDSGVCNLDEDFRYTSDFESTDAKGIDDVDNYFVLEEMMNGVGVTA